MYDIPELEKKWRKYRRNKIKKPIFFGVSALVLVAGISFVAIKYLNSGSASENKQTTSIAVKDSTQQATVKNATQKNTPAIVITKTPINGQIQQTKTVSQVNNVNNDDTIDLTNATIVKPDVPDDEIRVIGFDNNEKKEIKKKYQDILVPKKTTQEINEQEEVATYEDRFKATQDPQDSLYLAKYYYKKGNYAKAETWAVNTNNIDGDIEESWIIFAKARAKQGHRVDAIKVLQSYYDETGSQKAKQLLDKLRRNIPFK